MLAELLQHLEHHGELLFGEHADLKIEMRAALTVASHAILTDEHEDGEKNALGGDKKGQNAEWEGIESFHARNQVEIHGAPGGNQNRVEHKKFYAADEFYDGIADLLGRRPAIQGFFLELGDGGNIELGRILRNLVRHCFFHARSSGSFGIDIHTRDWQAIEYVEIYRGLTELVCVGASVSAG